jgi:uncharacterized protein
LRKSKTFLFSSIHYIPFYFCILICIFSFCYFIFAFFLELDKKRFLFNIITVMDLHINIRNLPKEGNLLNFDIKEENVSVKEITGEVHVQVGIQKSGNFYNVEGYQEYDLSLTCSRCLEEINRHEKRNFHLEFKKKADYSTNGELTRKTDETKNEYLVENNCINLGPFLRDQIILSVPMKPLCGEECEGLCPICGVNLNKTTCVHSKAKENSFT